MVSGPLKTEDFSNYAILELIQSYRVDVVNSRLNSNYKYFWWRNDYKQPLKKLLQQKWTNDLLNFALFIFNIENLRNNFNSTNFTDCESYLERLITIKEK